uniref:DNA-directed primase/polymerase protein n=1 Tax=Hirondellea gigas TaxID=1518452 RepID=A0A6A7G8N9_9CRUS
MITSFALLSRSAGISPEKFYGPRPKKVTRSLSKLQREIRQAATRSDFMNKYRRYYTLVKACAEADLKSGKSYRIFAEGKRLSGSLQFFVATYEGFWEKYSILPSEQKIFYEVIRTDYPCRLYFDLEFDRTINPTVDGEILLQDFIERLISQIRSKLDIEISEENIIDLDASSSKKFSRHLICHLPNAVFDNNQSMGVFVDELCSNLEDEEKEMNDNQKENDPSNEFSSDSQQTNSKSQFVLTEKKQNGSLITYRKCWIDRSVYSNNRCFRIISSSKVLQKRPFVLSKSCRFPVKSKRQLFFDSLICNVQITDSTRVIRCQPFRIPRGIASSGTMKPPDYIPSVAIDGKKCRFGSPFPEIDAFIQSEVKKRGRNGWIRRWEHLKTDNHEMIRYDIAVHRFCHRIGRHHKSNHIYLVVDLNEGVYHQHCLDKEDCVGYRSRPFRIPWSVFQQKQNEPFEEELRAFQTPQKFVVPDIDENDFREATAIDDSMSQTRLSSNFRSDDSMELSSANANTNDSQINLCQRDFSDEYVDLSAEICRDIDELAIKCRDRQY